MQEPVNFVVVENITFRGDATASNNVVLLATRNGGVNFFESRNITLSSLIVHVSNQTESPSESVFFFRNSH